MQREFVEPGGGERQPGHVVVIVVREAAEIADQDAAQQLFRPLQFNVGGGAAAVLQGLETGVHDGVEVVGLPPVVPFRPWCGDLCGGPCCDGCNPRAGKAHEAVPELFVDGGGRVAGKGGPVCG